MLQARQLIKECGDHETAIAGAVGEAHAEGMLSMKKHHAVSGACDGVINGLKFQVKTKERLQKMNQQTMSLLAIDCVLREMR